MLKKMTKILSNGYISLLAEKVLDHTYNIYSILQKYTLGLPIDMCINVYKKVEWSSSSCAICIIYLVALFSLSFVHPDVIIEISLGSKHSVEYSTVSNNIVIVYPGWLYMINLLFQKSVTLTSSKIDSFKILLLRKIYQLAQLFVYCICWPNCGKAHEPLMQILALIQAKIKL